MFFSISKEENPSYPRHYRMGNLIINTDMGWRWYNGFLTKGILDSFDISARPDNIADFSKLNEISVESDGIFCIIGENSNGVAIYTNYMRGFPLYVGLNEVTNLTKYDYQIFSENRVIVYDDLTVRITSIREESRNDKILNSEKAISIINDELSAAFTKMSLRSTSDDKFCIFLTGGLDTTLLYAYALDSGIRFNVLGDMHYDYDHFTILNADDINQNWAYKQLHHYRDKTFLISGAPGDEFMLRNPLYSAIWLKYHGIDIRDLLSSAKYKDSYHYTYFMEKKNYKIFKEEAKLNRKFDSFLDMRNTIFDMAVNDFQHWHLGLTLTWTPLHNRNILDASLSLPLEDGIGQIMNGDVTRKLIEMTRPKCLRLISPQKNRRNPMSTVYHYFNENRPSS